MQQVPKFVRGRLANGEAGPHPDPDLLTAFLERALADRERVRVLDHLSRCGECRDIVALAVPESAQLTVVARPTSWLPVLRWAAVACVLVAGVTVGLHYKGKAPQSAVRVSPSLAQAPAAEKVESPAQPELSAKLDAPAKPEIAARPQAKQPHAAENLEKKSNAVTPSIAARRDGQAAAGSVAAAPQPAANAGGSETLTTKSETEEPQDQAKSADTLAEAVPARAKEQTFSGKAKEPIAGAGKTLGAFANARNKQAVAMSAPAVHMPRWTLSSDGTLQRSFDSGQTWANVAVPTSATLRALAASGAEIWVGGSAGALYHSSDAGNQWIQVRPTAGRKSLTADIIGVEFTDPQNGKVTTANQETWITTDGGQSWQSR